MIIAKSDFDKIVKYVQEQLLKQLIPGLQINGYPVEFIGKSTVVALDRLITLDKFLMDTGNKKERVKLEVIDDKGFSEWWKNYPSSATFKYKGMLFSSSRVLRSNYQVCQMLYLKALSTNNITSEQLLKALQVQVNMMKKESFEDGQNRLQYMPGSEVYLRQGKYEAFINTDTELELTQTEDNEDSNCA